MISYLGPDLFNSCILRIAVVERNFQMRSWDRSPSSKLLEHSAMCLYEPH
jgi:hypothetical protein